MRSLWILAATVLSALVVAVPSLAVASIWTGDWRLGGISFVLLLCAIPAGAGFGFWTSDNKPPRAMPRADRKRLLSEQRRIALEKAIRDAEKAAGL